MEPRLYSCLHLITGLKCHFPSQATSPKPSDQLSLHPLEAGKAPSPGEAIEDNDSSGGSAASQAALSQKKGGCLGEKGVWATKNLSPP